MSENRILLQHGLALKSFRVTGETDKAIEIQTGKSRTWIPRKALRKDKQKIIYDGKFMNPHNVLKWFVIKEANFLNIFN